MPTAEEIKMSIDLIALISETVKLKKVGHEWMGLCPFHADTKPSLTVNPDKRLWYCHSCGAKGDCFNWIERTKQVSFEEAIQYLDSNHPQQRIVATYDYTDATGKLLYQVVRYEPKSFSQRQPDGKNWVWNLKGITPTLYHLPEVIKAIEDGKDIFIVEGEKDVDRLRAEGLIATCNSGGAGKWKIEYSQALSGANLIVIPDNDDVGLKHAQDIATLTKAKRLKLLKLDKKDVSDWMDAGNSVERLLELAQSQQPFSPIIQLSQPDIAERINGFTFTWADFGLIIAVQQLKVHSSDDRITGELLISVNKQPLHPPTSFNFTAERTRSSLVKTLTEANPQWPWAEIIKQLCISTINRARQGEPVQELWTNEDITPPEFLLEPILYQGLSTIMFGEKATCKSLLGIIAYTCLTLPWEDNPLGWETSKSPTPCLYLDYETTDKIVRYNTKRLQQAMGFPNFPVNYRRCTLPLVNDIERIQERCEEIGAKALIIDSLGPAVGGDLKSPEVALNFTTTLRKLNMSSLIIGQTSKDTESKKKTVYGSTFFEYYARNIFELRRIQEEGEDVVELALFHKYCNLGKKVSPMGFRVTFTNSTIDICRQPITAPEFIDHMGTQARILMLLKRGSMSSKEIMEALEINRGNTDMTLKRLKDRCKVIKIGDEWGLPAKELI